MQFEGQIGPRILRLDASGTPSWIGIKKFSSYVANEKVTWTRGTQMTIHGGVTRKGVESILEVPTIIGIRGLADGYHRPVIRLSRGALVMRDRHTCAYCGKVFGYDDLTMDHVKPHSQGGKRSWMNILSACKPCNNRKDCRTPEQAGMKMLFIPYVPDPYEGLILTNRRILADQMDFLIKSVSPKGRLLS